MTRKERLWYLLTGVLFFLPLAWPDLLGNSLSLSVDARAIMFVMWVVCYLIVDAIKGGRK